MSIQVKFFASLRETLGRAETTVDSARNVADVWKIATNDAPQPKSLMVAINLEHASLESIVNDGDEVAFFPPVTGG